MASGWPITSEFPARRVLITVDQAEQLATVTAPQDAAEFLAVLGGRPGCRLAGDGGDDRPLRSFGRDPAAVRWSGR